MGKNRWKADPPGSAEPAETASRQAQPGQAYRVIGTRPPRPDGTGKVTGHARFAADIRLPGMLYGAILRSPHAHARIKAIDTRAAQAMKGVKAIITAADLPEIPSQSDRAQQLRYQQENVLAHARVLYHGHAVAAVAAVDLPTAREALERIHVAYEILPPVLDIQTAMQPDAPILLDDLRLDDLGAKGTAPTNIAHHLQKQRGDLAIGFAAADMIVEREFKTTNVHHGYIEPQSATAQYASDGQLTIWCSSQSPFDVRRMAAEILQIEEEHIRVIPMEIGGGFGGKFLLFPDPLAALLSQRCQHRPVKITLTRKEVLLATSPAAGSVIRVKMGATRQGLLTAAQAHLVYECGAFPYSAVGAGAGVIFTSYRIPHFKIDGYGVVVNKPKTFDYRGSTSAIASAAAERVVDELCEQLQMDPLAFREMNAVREGDLKPNGKPFPRIGLLETLAAARAHPHYNTPLTGPNQGRGVAAAIFGSWDGGSSSVRAQVNPDGTIALEMGSVDLSGNRTTIAMQLAETLGIPVEAIHPHVADTDSVGYTDGTYGSRTTVITGWAVFELGEKLKTEMAARAARLWGIPPEAVDCENGLFSANGHSLSFDALASHLPETGPLVQAQVTAGAKGVGTGAAVHIVDVAVDPETGQVTILRYTALQDVGKAIHPGMVESQIQGAVAQGTGWALMEGYQYDADGRLQNPNLLDYKMPTCPDLPMIETVLLEIPDPGHPYGVRGAGELPILPPIAALANAIYRAAGCRLDTLPMTPLRILEAAGVLPGTPTEFS